MPTRRRKERIDVGLRKASQIGKLAQAHIPMEIRAKIRLYPGNMRWLAPGPRVRLSAGMPNEKASKIRDELAFRHKRGRSKFKATAKPAQTGSKGGVTNRYSGEYRWSCYSRQNILHQFIANVQHRVTDPALLQRISGVDITWVDRNDFPGSTALVRSFVPNAASPVVDDTNGPCGMAMTGIFVNKADNAETLEMRNLRDRPGARGTDPHTCRVCHER